MGFIYCTCHDGHPNPLPTTERGNRNRRIGGRCKLTNSVAATVVAPNKQTPNSSIAATNTAARYLNPLLAVSLLYKTKYLSLVFKCFCVFYSAIVENHPRAFDTHRRVIAPNHANRGKIRGVQLGLRPRDCLRPQDGRAYRVHPHVPPRDS